MKTTTPVAGLAALALLWASATPAAMSPAQQQEVEKIIENYLVSHPEVVIKAIHVWQQQQKEAKAALQKETISRLQKDAQGSSSPVLGNPKGSVTIVEFSDYNCPYCKKSYPRLSGVVKEDGDIRLVMKEFPVLGPGSEYAARAALAARKQGRYEAFHHAMMTNPGRATREQVDEVARKVGLDLAQLKKDMESPEVTMELEKNRIWAERLGINGTPAFVIGDRLVPGAIDAATMKKLVKEARSGNEK